jgi:hypothetical protein
VIVPAAPDAQLEAAVEQKSSAERCRDFNDTYKEWIAAQHGLMERVGVIGDEFRRW